VLPKVYTRAQAPKKRVALPPRAGAAAGKRTTAEERGVSHREQISPEPQRRVEERPPGQFVTAELQSDCSRFLEAIREVVRRRIEAGLGRQQ
jgi:hypothetical protein